MSEIDMELVQKHFDEISAILSNAPGNVSELVLINLVSAFAAALMTQRGVDPEALIRGIARNALRDARDRLRGAGIHLSRPN